MRHLANEYFELDELIEYLIGYVSQRNGNLICLLN